MKGSLTVNAMNRNGDQDNVYIKYYTIFVLCESTSKTLKGNMSCEITVVEKVAFLPIGID